jgi:hypothetical protein
LRGIGLEGIGFGRIGTGIGVLMEVEVHCSLTKISDEVSGGLQAIHMLPKFEAVF